MGEEWCGRERAPGWRAARHSWPALHPHSSTQQRRGQPCSRQPAAQQRAGHIVRPAPPLRRWRPGRRAAQRSAGLGPPPAQQPRSVLQGRCCRGLSWGVPPLPPLRSLTWLPPLLACHHRSQPAPVGLTRCSRTTARPAWAVPLPRAAPPAPARRHTARPHKPRRQRASAGESCLPTASCKSASGPRWRMRRWCRLGRQTRTGAGCALRGGGCAQCKDGAGLFLFPEVKCAAAACCAAHLASRLLPAHHPSTALLTRLDPQGAWRGLPRHL